MNASKFMDKQIMELSGTKSNDFLELLDSQQDDRQNNGAGKKEEILPSYDFQPTRTAGSSPPPIHLDGARSWASEDSKATPFNFRNHSSLEPHKSSEVIHEKGRDTHDTATMIEIDHTVKKYVDNLLHALDGVSARLSQLESRTRRLESSVDDLKVTICDNCGSTEGKLMQQENILREVQTGVQFLRDKQEIVEAQMELAKLHASEGDHQSPDSWQHHLPLAPPQIQHSFQPPVASPQPPSVPAPNAPPPPPRQQNPPSIQFPAQVPHTQIHQQYQVPPQQPQVPPQHSQVPPQQSQVPPQQPQYHQPSQPTSSPQFQPSFSHHPEEPSPYMQSQQTYLPSVRQSGPLNQPPIGPPPQQFYGPNPNMYETPVSRPSSGGPPPFSAGYGPPSGPGFSESYPYSGPPSHYSSSSMKAPPSAGGPSGGSSRPRLPTAQVLPQALPAGSSGGTGNRVAIDDVVDKVSTMGFSRDQVRATVRRLTENGQSVDLNVVLDKLMNDSEIQPQKGWYGR